jgi:MoaA/NifB/PqqE/SkfB family radical SAM enzyme
MENIVKTPLWIGWEVTRICNLRCKHCFNNSGVALKDELTSPEAMHVLRQLKAARVVSINFSGGEPLLRRDIFDLLETTAQEGLSAVLCTNGTLVDKETARRLRELGVIVRISLDGATRHVHDSLRGQGTFATTTKAIRSLVNAGVQTTIISVISELNVNQVPSILRYAMKLKVHSIGFSNFLPVGRGKLLSEYTLSLDKTRRLDKYLSRKREELQRSNLKVLSFSIGMFSENVENFASCFITPDGFVKPTELLPLVVGNVRKDRISDLWKKIPKVWSENLDNMRRSRLYQHLNQGNSSFDCQG